LLDLSYAGLITFASGFMVTALNSAIWQRSRRVFWTATCFSCTAKHAVAPSFYTRLFVSIRLFHKIYRLAPNLADSHAGEIKRPPLKKFSIALFQGLQFYFPHFFDIIKARYKNKERKIRFVSA